MSENTRELIKKDIDKVIKTELNYLDNMENDVEIFKYIIEKQLEIFKLYKAKDIHLQNLVDKDKPISKYFRVEEMYNRKIEKTKKKSNHKIYNKTGYPHKFWDSQRGTITYDSRNGFKYVLYVGKYSFERHILISGFKFTHRIDKPSNLLGDMDLGV